MENPRRRCQDNIEMDLTKAWRAQNFSILEEMPVADCISKRNTHSNSKRGEEFLNQLSGP
jgi:hypothetical protein